VGTLLSSVAMQSEILAIDAPEEKVERFDKLSKMSREAMGRMRDTVWAIDSRKDNMISLVDRMEDHLADSFEPSDLNYNFEKVISKDALIPPNIRQNVYLIFKEAVTNAIKYSNGSEVNIILKQNKKSIHLSIKDNGSIDPGNIRTSGTGLSNIKMRSERIGGQLNIEYENGFGVHLNCKW
jgi:signal transduction histidine kinase